MRHGLPVILLLALAAPALAQAEPAQSANEFSSIDAVANPDPSAIAGVFPDGAPSLLTPESMATSYRLPTGVQPPDTIGQAPAGMKYSDGQLHYEVGTNMKTNRQVTSIIPQVPDPRMLGGAAGGSGEVKGQVRTPEGQWELFGGQRFGMTDGGPPVAQGLDHVRQRLPATRLDGWRKNCGQRRIGSVRREEGTAGVQAEVRPGRSFRRRRADLSAASDRYESTDLRARRRQPASFDPSQPPVRHLSSPRFSDRIGSWR